MMMSIQVHIIRQSQRKRALRRAPPAHIERIRMQMCIVDGSKTKLRFQ